MTENSILFRKEFDIRDSFEVRNNVKRLTLSGVTSIIRELSYDLGVRASATFDRGPTQWQDKT